MSDDISEALALANAERDAAEAEIDRLRSLIEWRPIKTAEKTPGNRILCFGEDTIFEAECDSDDGERYWCSIGGIMPTHWMPLPDPPNAQDSGR